MHISLKPEIIGFISGLPISNSLVLSLLTSFLLVGTGLLIVRSLRLIPAKTQNGAEIVIGTIYEFIAQNLGDREQAKKFFPLLATIFLFILFNNWIGVLPGTGSFGFKEIKDGEELVVPFFRSANSDLNTTLALAIITVAAIQIYGIRKFGILGQISKYLVFNKGPVHFFVGLFELIGELTRVVSFSFRLFGNIFAGEVLLLIIMTLVPVVAPLPFLLLEFFVGFVQALVFAMLALIFLKVGLETSH